MSTTDFSGQREGEEVEFIFRRHWLETRKGFFFFVIFTALGFLPLIFWHSDYAFWIWLGCLAIGLLGFAYMHMLWHYSVYVVTNQRLRQISQRGLFKRSVVDLGLDKIQSISYNVPGVLGGVMGYGTLLIQTQVGDMEINMVARPEETYNKLQDLLGRIEIID